MVAGGAGWDVRAARLISLAFSSPLRFPGLFALLPFFFFLPYRNAFCKYIPAPFFVFFLFVCLF